MKTLLLFALFLSSTTAFSQRSEQTLSAKTVPPVEFEFNRIVYGEGDTSFVLFAVFQNAKYTYITDTEVLGFNKKEDLDSFIVDLIKCQSFVDEKEKGQSISYSGKRYTLSVYDFSDLIFLENPSTGGYCRINKKTIPKIIEYLSTVSFEG